ncbi:MAG: MogA/MoaB family molybdenum cofactor biosynthesis protein [Thermoproteota archaeon]
MSRTSRIHKKAAPGNLGVAILTVSTSKHKKRSQGIKVDDASGDIIEGLIKQAGHRVVDRDLIPDDLNLIRTRVEEALGERGVDVLIVTGGTGISRSDVTVEAVEGLLEKKLPGFGEIFRQLSYAEMGSPAMLTRASAGVREGKAVFLLPGSPEAVELAVKRLILPEMAHIVKHAREG